MERDDLMVVDITVYKIPMEDARKIIAYAAEITGKTDFGMFSSSIGASPDE